MPKNIELLLLENVDNLGIVGDVVHVKAGYARNFLLPRGMATSPTPKAIERLAERRKMEEARLRQLKAEQEQLLAKLDGYELTVQRSANEQGVLYGGVTQHDIAEALQEDGYAIEDRHVRIGEQIKRLDSYMIPIVLDKDLKTEIKLWVVSDKPIEELEESAGEGEGEGAGEAGDGEQAAPQREFYAPREANALTAE